MNAPDSHSLLCSGTAILLHLALLISRLQACSKQPLRTLLCPNHELETAELQMAAHCHLYGLLVWWSGTVSQSLQHSTQLRGRGEGLEMTEVKFPVIPLGRGSKQKLSCLQKEELCYFLCTWACVSRFTACSHFKISLHVYWVLIMNRCCIGIGSITVTTTKLLSLWSLYPTRETVPIWTAEAFAAAQGSLFLRTRPSFGFQNMPTPGLPPSRWLLLLVFWSGSS